VEAPLVLWIHIFVVVHLVEGILDQDQHQDHVEILIIGMHLNLTDETHHLIFPTAEAMVTHEDRLMETTSTILLDAMLVRQHTAAIVQEVVLLMMRIFHHKMTDTMRMIPGVAVSVVTKRRKRKRKGIMLPNPAQDPVRVPYPHVPENSVVDTGNTTILVIAAVVTGEA